MEITLKKLKQWRLRAQYLTENAEAIRVAGDLCGIQSQYAANALHALRIRSESIDMKGLVKSWTLRGTLHLFPEKDLRFLKKIPFSTAKNFKKPHRFFALSKIQNVLTFSSIHDII